MKRTEIAHRVYLHALFTIYFAYNCSGSFNLSGLQSLVHIRDSQNVVTLITVTTDCTLSRANYSVTNVLAKLRFGEVVPVGIEI